jgi:hypothetical protein
MLSTVFPEMYTELFASTITKRSVVVLGKNFSRIAPDLCPTHPLEELM